MGQKPLPSTILDYVENTQRLVTGLASKKDSKMVSVCVCVWVGGGGGKNESWKQQALV